jgi:hypothetical protein
VANAPAKYSNAHLPLGYARRTAPPASLAELGTPCQPALLAGGADGLSVASACQPASLAGWQSVAMGFAQRSSPGGSSGAKHSCSLCKQAELRSSHSARVCFALREAVHYKYHIFLILLFYINNDFFY